MTECERRGWHRAVRLSGGGARCKDCPEFGTEAWGRSELRKQGDFLQILGNAIIEQGNRELRERAQFRAVMEKHA